MRDRSLQSVINQIIDNVDHLIPAYSANPADSFAGGNVAVCIIDKSGMVHGNIWGTDKIRGRHYFHLAWTKASQVWITGMKTGEYEKRLFNGEVDESVYGIQKPDLVGWEGGQPITLPDGTTLSIGFSGFRGVNDLEIVAKATATIRSTAR
jgi:glc operon protein GlcG